MSLSIPAESLRQAQQGWVPIRDLLRTAEAAEVLGVSRQRVVQLVDAGTLPETRVGGSLVLARSAVEARRDAGRSVSGAKQARGATGPASPRVARCQVGS